MRLDERELKMLRVFFQFVHIVPMLGYALLEVFVVAKKVYKTSKVLHTSSTFEGMTQFSTFTASREKKIHGSFFIKKICFHKDMAVNVLKT